MTRQDMINKRYEYNQRILDVLKVAIKKQPQLRFGQLLYCLNIISSDKKGNIIDPFYTESVEIYNQINKKFIYGLQS